MHPVTDAFVENVFELFIQYHKILRIRHLCHRSNTTGVELQGGAWGGTSFPRGGGIYRFSEVSRVPNKTENKNGRS